MDVPSSSDNLLSILSKESVTVEIHGQCRDLSNRRSLSEENVEDIEEKTQEKTSRKCGSNEYTQLPEEAAEEKRAPVNEQMTQSLIHGNLEIPKQTNDTVTDESEDYGTEDGIEDDDGTDNSKEDDDGTVDSREHSCSKKDESSLYYSTYETQVSEGGEADLHKHLVDCKKNPGHTRFVPITDFNINHLPEGYHDNDLVEFIKATAALTLRIDVKMTSTERPEFWPNTTMPYTFYNMRGSDVMRVGTGMVWYVNKRTEKDNKGTCQCDKCQHSDTPSKVWGKVKINTARHVVFDTIEAIHTTCRLFYDRQDSPLVTVDGWRVWGADIEDDRCWLDCVTCDVFLLDILDKMLRHWFDMWEKVYNKYESSRDKVKLTFIVSHPHGCPKQISVGHWINRYVVRDDRWTKYTRYTYTTCTCPGSGGARVHTMGYYDDWSYYNHHVHSGVNSEGTNFSGIGRDRI